MSPNTSYTTDREFAERFMPSTQDIFLSHLGEMAQMRTASNHEDMRQATDLLVDIAGLTVAVRVRRPGCRYRDLTLRYRRLVAGRWTGGFEVDKMLTDFVRWYFYGWTEGTEPLLWLGDWMIVDMDKVRAWGLIENATETGREKENDDHRTTFTWITHHELHTADALVASDIDRTPTRREIMRKQIPNAISRLQAKNSAVDIDSVARELGGLVRAGQDRDLVALWPEFEGS
jgi:hypothetical protein